MVKVKKSEYIIISKKIIRLLLRETCWGKGSMYFDNIKKSGFKDNEIPLVEDVINGLVKQALVMKKKHKYGLRWIVETVFSVLDRRFGTYVTARKYPNMQHEMLFKAQLHNQLL